MKEFYEKYEARIARIAIIAIFLALIRTIAEIFRLHYYATVPMTYEELKPYMVAALISSVTCFIMVISSFYARHKIIIVMGVFTVIYLLIIKFIYHPLF